MLDLDHLSHNRIITLTQGDIAKAMVRFTHGKNMFLDHFLSRVTWMGMILHTIDVHDPGVVVVGGICPVRTLSSLIIIIRTILRKYEAPFFLFILYVLIFLYKKSFLDINKSISGQQEI